MEIQLDNRCIYFISCMVSNGTVHVADRVLHNVASRQLDVPLILSRERAQTECGVVNILPSLLLFTWPNFGQTTQKN